MICVTVWLWVCVSVVLDSFWFDLCCCFESVCLGFVLRVVCVIGVFVYWFDSVVVFGYGVWCVVTIC